MGWRKYQKSYVKKRKGRGGKGLFWKKEWNKPCCMVLTLLLVVFCISHYHTSIRLASAAYLSKKLSGSCMRGAIISPASFKQTSENEYTMNIGHKKKAISTLLPFLQNAAVDLFQQYKIPVGAVVALDPSTGAILAMASQGNNPINHRLPLTLSSSYPAASIFKIVTLSAALEQEIIQPDDILKATKRLKYDGKWIQDSSNVSSGPISVGNALAKSCNTAFATMAIDVGHPCLEKYAARFGFNSKLCPDMPVEVSSAVISDETYDIAASGAGFGDINMSPLHGALIAASIANKGKIMKPTLVKQIVNTEGKILATPSSQVMRTPITPETAEIIKTMMVQTVHGEGNAHKAFYDRRGNPYLSGIKVAGKTGSLSCKSQPKNCTWFVGFAPADNPEIAIAVLIVNYDTWRAKACTVTRKLLEAYFEGKDKNSTLHMVNKRHVRDAGS
ncbi:MAG: penicillin-binding transpeptidase domain-containing protein [bacterium]|nr:penicillin-binding transpeptidase domain-containing protein [bacterium]